jgi:hypothetical protein
MTTWIMRVGGWLLMWFGIMLLFSPVIYTLTWIPLVGYLMAHGFSFVVALFAMVVSLTLSSLTMGVAWLYYRPLWGIMFLSVVGVGIALIFYT